MKKLAILLLLALSVTQVSADIGRKYFDPADNKSLKKAEKAYQQFEFVEAIDFYKSAFLREPENTHITRRLGECYRKLGLLDESKYWYKQTVEREDVESDDLYYYARVLTGLGEYDDARTWYKRYHQLRPEDERVLPVIQNETYFEDLLAMNPAHEVRNLALNNDKPTLCAIPFEEGILFSAVGIGAESATEEDLVYWEFNQYLDMFYATVDDEGHITDPHTIEQLNTLFNDGPVAYDNVSNTLFVTQNQTKRNKPIADKNGNVQLKVQAFHYEDGNWSDAGEFPYNSTEYSVAHPAISQDGNWLYFASNMPGGYGATDIYRCHRDGDSWSFPENLGPSINTPDNEVFPFESDNNILYFSSNGYPGLGGLDVFRSFRFDNAWMVPENMGVPINSPQDDFGLTFVEKSSGFFSSNRKGRGLDDDIFWFDLLSRRRFFEIAMNQLGEMEDLSIEEFKLLNLDTGEQIDISVTPDGITSFEAMDNHSYELSWMTNGEENKMLFLSNESDVSSSIHTVGDYAIEQEIGDEVAVDVRLTDLLKSQSNDLEKLVSEFQVYNVTDNMLYLNDDTSVPSWMDDYAIKGTFDYADGLVDMHGTDVVVKNRETGEVLLRTVEQNGTIEFPINPEHEYEVFWIEDETLYKHVLTPEGDDYQVDNALAHNSILDVELIDHAAARTATVSLRMGEVDPAKMQNGEVKVINRTTGAITTYDLDAEDGIDIIGASEHGYEIFWKENDMVSMHTVTPNDEELLVVDHNQPYHLLDAFVMNDDGTIRAKLKDTSLVENVMESMEMDQIVLMDKESEELQYIDPMDGQAVAQVTDWHDYLLLWKKETETLSYDLTYNEAGDRMVAVPRPGTPRPLRTDLADGQLALSLGELVGQSISELDLDWVYFDFDRSNIRPQDEELLIKAVTIMESDPTAKLAISGHTDVRGTVPYNDGLSQDRATSVQRYLESRGIASDRVAMEWEGELRPVETCAEDACTEEQHQLNRRVEIKLISQSESTTDATPTAQAQAIPDESEMIVSEDDELLFDDLETIAFEDDNQPEIPVSNSLNDTTVEVNMADMGDLSRLMIPMP